jgi:hypothetical protein
VKGLHQERSFASRRGKGHEDHSEQPAKDTIKIRRIRFFKAHLAFPQKKPPPTLCRWSDDFAPESVKTSDAPAGFIPVER